MEFYFQIKMNEKLFLRNPEETELGRKIIENSVIMIHDLGFESFTFKKLADKTGTTEASIYRYFENKHRLLVYLVAWYWSWLEYQVLFHTHNLKDPVKKLKKVIKILAAGGGESVIFQHIDKTLLYQIVVADGSKAYHTSHVTQDNKDKLFKPYKDLCSRISDIIHENNSDYKFSRSLASTIVEIAHLQIFFMKNLPSLTDCCLPEDKGKIAEFLEDIVFSTVSNNNNKI